MAKQASIAELHDLHRMVVKSLTSRIEQDMHDDLPTDAATLGAAIKLLKDNAITADPADADDLTKMRETLSRQAGQRKERTGNVLQLATSDYKAMEG